MGHIGPKILMGLEYILHHLQTRGGYRRFEALTLSKLSICCSRVCALVKEIYNLEFRKHILKSSCFFMTMWPGNEGISTNIFCQFMLHMIISNLYDSHIVTEMRNGRITGDNKIYQEPSKSHNLESCSGNSLMLCLSTRSTYIELLVSHMRGEEPRMQ